MASNESEMDVESACNVARRTARNKMLEVCGTREEKVNATARDMGLVGETEGFNPDPDALLSGTVSSALEAREAALAAVWYDNPATGEALIDQHDGDFSAAMAEAWDVVDGLEADESGVEAEETVEEALEDDEDEEAAEEPETGVESDDSDEDEFVPLEDVGTDEDDEEAADDGEVDEAEEEPDEESPEPIEAEDPPEEDEEPTVDEIDVPDDDTEEVIEEMAPDDDVEAGAE